MTSSCPIRPRTSSTTRPSPTAPPACATRPPPPLCSRRVGDELGHLLAYEAPRALPMTEIELQTPVALAKVHRIATRPVVAPILRAGLGLLPGFLAVVDDAVVAHLGLSRDPKTLPES